MLILLACNSPDNGMDTGYFESAAIELDDGENVELECPRMRVQELDGKKVRIGRRVFDYRSSREWVGNWCWNAWNVDAEVGQAIMDYLRFRGAHCTCGPTEIYDSFNREDAKR